MDMATIDQILNDASAKIHQKNDAALIADAKKLDAGMSKIDFSMIEKLIAIRGKIIEYGMEEDVKKIFSSNIPDGLLKDISWNCDPTYHTFGYFPDMNGMGVLSRGCSMPDNNLRTLQFDFCSSGLYLEAHYRWMKSDRDEYPAYHFRTARGVLDALVDTYPNGYGLKIGKDVLMSIISKFGFAGQFNGIMEKTLSML